MRKLVMLCLVSSTFGVYGAVNVPLTIQEAVYPGSVAGVSRTLDPVTVGIPLPDDPNSGATDVNQLALTGAGVGQFRVLGRWPSGRIKWVLVDTQATLAAGQVNNFIVLVSGGSGNFGGANLAADNGPTITVATGGATFTINKAKFNVVDQVLVGGATIVASGSSQGLVLTGPSPGQATCPPCTTVYSSANDPNSTAVIEENGPAKAVIKATGSHVDASGNVYMHFTVRMYFYKGKSSVKVTSILRNADYGASNSLNTAFKGLSSYEVRVTPNISGGLNWKVGTDSTQCGGVCSGTMTGTDQVYLYQGQNNQMTGGAVTWVVPPTTDVGYVVYKNASSQATGDINHYPTGWADIADANGAGVQIGLYQMSAYWPKSLELGNGGKDVRVGIWPSENGNPTGGIGHGTHSVYMPWPELSIHDVFLNFHSSALYSPVSEFLKFQHYLIGRANRAVYNTTSVFLHKLTDPATEDSFYSTMGSTAVPAFSYKHSFPDLGTSNSNWPLYTYRLYRWSNPGGGNQMEFHLSDLYNYIRRGQGGRYLDAAHFYRLVAEKAFPFLDGDSWKNHAGDLDTQLFPGQSSANYAQVYSSGAHDWADEEHKHWYGMPEYYFLTGDETIKDAISQGPTDRFTPTSIGNANRGSLWNSRAIGNELMSVAHLFNYYSTIGDDANASAALTQGTNAFNLQVKPDLCVSGYPSGCTIAGSKGVSRVRGIHYGFNEGDLFTACGGGPNDYRINTAFQDSILNQGLMSFRAVKGPGWADYSLAMDLALGISNWALTEDYKWDGTGRWDSNGFRYYINPDVPNNVPAGCAGPPTNSFDYYNSPQGRDTIWYIFNVQHDYFGTTTWAQKATVMIQRNLANGDLSDLGQYPLSLMIDKLQNPGSSSSVTVPITAVTNNGGGSYTVSWTVPPGAQSYRLKTAATQIVDWIGFDAGTNQFIGNPATTKAWFAATDVANLPAPGTAGTTQQFTVTGLPATGQFFALKAVVIGATTTPPAVSITAPAAGTTVSGTLSVSANASSSVGIAGVQFQLDGGNLGGLATGSGPSYSVPWVTTTAAAGSHNLSAVVTDTLGNTAAASISITVSNAIALPMISSVTAVSISSSGAVITWTTDKPADSQVAYGTTAASGTLSLLGSTLSTSHSVTLSGLAGSTAYNYKVMSRDAGGNLASSGDFTFTTALSAGGGTLLPTGTWTMVPTHGFPEQAVGWEKLVYSPAAKKSIMLSNYHEMGTEPNRGMMAYDFGANRWDVMDSGNLGHTENMPEGGHPVGTFAYDPNEKVVTYYCCGSGSNQIEVPFHTWWFDPVGQVGRDKAVSPKPGTYQEATAAFDSAKGKMIFSSAGWVYDPAANVWSQSNPAHVVQGGGIFPANFDARSMASMAYDSANGKTYMFGGRLNYGPGQTFYNDVVTYDSTTNTWTLLKPSGTPPSPRQKAGWAYDSTNNVFLMFGGHNDSGGVTASPLNDTWVYDPVANSWTQLAPPQSPAPNFGVFERMAYDPDDNAFVLVVDGTGGYADGPWSAGAAQTWLFRYKGTGPNPGSLAPVYGPTSGGINRNSDGWAQEPALASSGSVLYSTWIETGKPFDGGTGAWPHTFASRLTNSSWTAMGNSYLSINSEFNGFVEAFSPSATVSGGTPWISYYQGNNSQENPAKVYAKQWTGVAWQGAPIGPGGAGCGSPNILCHQSRSSLADVAGRPYIAFIEKDNSFTLPCPTLLYVKQWNGKNWGLLGTGPLNRGAGRQVAESVSIASDGSHPYVAWTEYTITSDQTNTVPQVFVSRWDGTQWVAVGGALNVNSRMGWAFDASIAFLSGQPYVAWTERTQNGNSQLYVKTFNGSNWILTGSGSLNKDTNTGWSFRPSLVSDGTSLYVGWAEQLAIGQRVQAYVDKYNGGTWTPLGSSLNANAALGSAQRVAVAVVGGQPAAAWGEVNFGSARQIFLKQWNGSSWVAPGGTLPTAGSCDLNADGVVNNLDVQLALNQALGAQLCTNADLQQNGQCNVVDVQRVIVASLGGTCLLH